MKKIYQGIASYFQESKCDNDCLESLYQMGDLGLKLFEQKKYPASKMILVQTCTQLYELLKNNKVPENEGKKANEQLRYYLKIAESAKQMILKMEDVKNEYTRVIKESILIMKPNVFFKDIIGLEKEKEALKECLIYPNQRPDLFQGIRSPPKGILFFGPPGNGKTMLAKGVASECSGTFFNVSASTLVSKYLGDAEKLLKALFQLAYLHQPSIIYIDEIDSILTSRSENEHEASRRLKTEFLLQFDGVGVISDIDRVTVIGTTNRPQELDTAALRRFTKRILIDQPNQKTIAQLIQKTLENVKYNITSKEFDQIAKQAQGYSCADLMAVIKEASMAPLRKQQNILQISVKDIQPITKQDVIDALSKVQPTVSKKELLFYQNWANNNKNNSN